MAYIFLILVVTITISKLVILNFAFSDIFSLGFGPFRWVCTSGLAEDLQKTDEIAIKIFNDIVEGGEN